MSLDPDKTYKVCRVVQMVNETHMLDSSYILREVAGSSPATATKINSKEDRIMKQNQTIDDQEVKYILRQIGFGAVLGIAFLATLYIGGLLAQCVGNF